MKKLTIFLLGLLAFGSALAQTQVPNTFQAGQPARAAEVNANFDAVEAAIDQNSASISANASDIADFATNVSANNAAIAVNSADIRTNAAAIENNSSAIAVLSAGSGIPVYAGAVRLGFLISASDVNGSLYLLSPLGYAFRIGGSPSNQPGDFLTPAPVVYFSGTDCQGNAYISEASGFPLSVGAVFIGDGGPTVAPAFYTPRGTKTRIASIAQQSFAANNRCTNQAETRNGVWEVFPNDEAVTGVSATPPTEWPTLGQP